MVILSKFDRGKIRMMIESTIRVDDFLSTLYKSLSFRITVDRLTIEIYSYWHSRVG